VVGGGDAGGGDEGGAAAGGGEDVEAGAGGGGGGAASKPSDAVFCFRRRQNRSTPRAATRVANRFFVRIGIVLLSFGRGYTNYAGVGAGRFGGM
jgi:hypothetical protein